MVADMRTSTRTITAITAAILLIPVALIALMWGANALLVPLVGVETAAIVIVSGGLALAAGLTAGFVIYDRNPAHRSWRLNPARYPAVKAAMERYKEKGERVRRVLPAFVIEGKRYFLVKYVRSNKEWGPKAEAGMVVLDDQGKVQANEALFSILLGYGWHVEDAFAFVMIQAREEVIAGAERAEREFDAVRRFFAEHVVPNTDAQVGEALEAFLGPLSEQIRRLAGMYEQQGRWCRANGRGVEFSAEEMEPLRVAKRETSQWLTENANNVARGWRTLQQHRSTIETLPGLDSGQRSYLRRLLRGLEASAKATMDADNYRMEHAPERIEAFRTRTAKALQLGKHHA
jgi:hypothetical protein